MRQHLKSSVKVVLVQDYSPLITTCPDSVSHTILDGKAYLDQTP